MLIDSLATWSVVQSGVGYSGLLRKLRHLPASHGGLFKGLNAVRELLGHGERAWFLARPLRMDTGNWRRREYDITAVQQVKGRSRETSVVGKIVDG